MAIQPDKFKYNGEEEREVDELLQQMNTFGEEIKRLKASQKELDKIVLKNDAIKNEKVIKEQEKYEKEVEELLQSIRSSKEELLRLKRKKDKLKKELDRIEKEDSKQSILIGVRGAGKSGSILQTYSRMKTHEQYIDEVRALVGDEYTVIGTYKGATKKIRFRHNICGFEYEVIPSGFTSKGNRCPECTKSLKGKGRKEHETFVEEVHEAVRDEYTVLENYKSSKTKVLMRHNVCGHEWKVSPHLFLSGTRCPKCAGDKKKEELGRTHDDYIKEINKIHKGEYSILGKYVNGNTKILAQHNECGYQWEVRAQSLLGYTRCPKCYGVLRKTQEEFEDQVKEVSRNEYVVIGEYVNNRTDIEILHQICGHIFEVTPNAFLQGKRCPVCKSINKE